MTTVLKIASTGLVGPVIDKYRIWCDAREFYKLPFKRNIEHSQDGIPCYHFTDLPSINTHTNSLIAIDCLTEGLHSKTVFDQYNKTNKYLIFSNGTWDKQFHKFDFEYEIMYHKFFLFEMCDTYHTPNRFCFYLDKEYKFGVKPYLFISTIGNVRPERDLLVDQLTSNLKTKKFLLRYSGQDINGFGNKDVITIAPGEFDPYISLSKKHFHTISQSLPIALFNQGYFNLTVETDLTLTNEFFLTEKTIKNLIVGMPFVIVSTQHFLKHLRALGFETYSTLWDESYDDVEDYQSRVAKIVDLCNNLIDFDWAAAKDELVRIGNANRIRFLSLNTELDKEFLALEEIAETYEISIRH